MNTIKGNNISKSQPQPGQALVWDGQQWAAASVAASLEASGQNVTSAEVLGSDGYADLSTEGPKAVVNVGASGTLILWLGCRCSAAASVQDASGMMSFELSGANTLQPSDDNATVGKCAGVEQSAQRTIVLTGLQPGVTTVVAKYRNGSRSFPSEPVTYSHRDLAVIAP